MPLRQAFLSLLLAIVVAQTANAQEPAKVPRLCIMTFDPGTLQSSLRSDRFAAFYDRLRELGHVEPKTISIDYLSANGRDDRFASLAAECLRLKSDVIVVTTTPAALAAKKATSTVPIVMLALGDPVGTGLVKSLAQPGGNVTGLTFMANALAAKRLEVLKEAFPRISRVLVLTYLADPISRPQIDAMRKVGTAVGVTLLVHDVRGPEDFELAFKVGVGERADAMLTTSASLFFVHNARVVELATKYKLPAIYPHASNSSVGGGLMSYSANIDDLHGLSAVYVDKILKGAKPADLPVQQATRFDFVVNLKTAKALGFTIPQSILLRATQVAE